MVMGDTPVWSKSIGEWKLLSDVPALCEGDEVLVYCFRGGLRSSSVAWLLRVAGSLD